MLTEFYQKKKKISKKACVGYKNLSKEEKEKKRQYGCEPYKNLLEDEKTKVSYCLRQVASGYSISLYFCSIKFPSYAIQCIIWLDY